MATSLLTLRPDLPFYSERVSLDDEEFVLEFKWNPRDACWYLSVYDVNEDPIVVGRKVVIDMPLLARFRRLGLPKGDLIATDTTGKGLDAGEQDLGSRVVIGYIDGDDLSNAV